MLWVTNMNVQKRDTFKYKEQNFKTLKFPLNFGLF